VIKLDPASDADSGSNATLAQFANEYPGMIASSVELAIPNSKGTPTPHHLPQWSDLSFDLEVLGSDRSGGIRLLDFAISDQARDHDQSRLDQVRSVLRVTLAFDPKGVTPAPPSQTTVNAMSASIISSVNTTTTTASTATTTTTLAALRPRPRCPPRPPPRARRRRPRPLRAELEVDHLGRR